ncbi:MAG: hypothetical protein WCP06_01885 [Verrucomicrobiota bacterium]
MKHTFLALAFAVATLTACSTKPAPAPQDGKATVPAKVCPAKKCVKKA